MSSSVITIGIGVFTGFMSGLMGIGGGALGTPLIRLILKAPAIISLATTMPVMFPSALSGLTAYVKEKKVDWGLAGALIIVAAPMTWLGALLTTQMSGQLLMILTAVFLLVVGSSFLVRKFLLTPDMEKEPDKTQIGILKVVVVGAIGGFLAGVLAIGGGIIYVPAILRIFDRPMKVALATSLIVVTAVSIPGTITHAWLGHIDWTIAGLISLGTLPSAYLGARFALKLRNKTLETMFGVLMIVFGIYFLISQL